MSKEQAQEAIRKISNIIDQWTEMRMDANDALELLAPLLAILTSYLDLEQIPAAGSSSDPNLETPGAEEYEVEKEELQDSEPEPGDLFSKESEDHEDKDESKSKSKKRKFAGSNGEIPF